MTGLENIERLKNFFKVIDQEKFLKEKKIEYYYIEPHITFLKEIEKELKALEIINEKGLPLGERDMILHSKDYEEYTINFSWANFKNISIQKTKEEFKILKEVLK